jgi:hypothetical protein
MICVLGIIYIMPKTCKAYYRNVEYHNDSGRKTIRKVYINGKVGHKTVYYYEKGKRKVTKKALTRKEMDKIMKREFIPGLFDNCVVKN